MPLWATLLSAMLLGDRLTRAKLAALGLGLAGLALLIVGEWRAIGAAPAGAFFMLAAALSWGASAIVVKRHRWTMRSWPLTAWQVLLGGLPIVILAPLIEPDFTRPGVSLATIPPLTWATLLYCATVPVVFCQWGWVRLLQMFPASLAAISTLMIPVRRSVVERAAARGAGRRGGTRRARRGGRRARARAAPGRGRFQTGGGSFAAPGGGLLEQAPLPSLGEPRAEDDEAEHRQHRDAEGEDHVVDDPLQRPAEDVAEAGEGERPDPGGGEVEDREAQRVEPAGAHREGGEVAHAVDEAEREDEPRVVAAQQAERRLHARVPARKARQQGRPVAPPDPEVALVAGEAAGPARTNTQPQTSRPACAAMPMKMTKVSPSKNVQTNTSA